MGLVLVMRWSCLSLTFSCCHAFLAVTPYSRQIPVTSQSSSTAVLVNSDDLLSWEVERDELREALQKLEHIEVRIRDDGDGYDQLSKEIDLVEDKFVNLSNVSLVPPPGLSVDQYKAAINSFFHLPISVKVAITIALDCDESSEPEIVSRIYEEGPRLTPQKLKDAMARVKDAMAKVQNTKQAVGTINALTDMLSKEISNDSGNGGTENLLSLDAPVWQEASFESVLPRVVLDEENPASPKSLDTLMSVLETSNAFQVKGEPQKVPGGYLIRGTNLKATGKDFVDTIDEKLPSEFPATVSLMHDFMSTSIDDAEFGQAKESNEEQVILLCKKDFSQSNNLIGVLSTFAALTTTLIAAVESYNGNDVVTRTISEATALSDFSGLDWFNVKLLDTFLPLVAIQAVHELGHFLVAKRDNFETTPPTPLPMFILPNLGLKTGIKTPPKDLTSLFDFAFVGPFMGIFASLVFLVLGAKLTLAADPEALALFPSLPVSTLRFSSLGGSILDFLFGGEGVLTGRSPTDGVILHPYAIAGFFGFMINSLDMLPLGSTDGGRISQALFRRKRHEFTSGVVWCTLLLFSFFPGADVLTAAWVVYNFSNGGSVEPCREEVDDVDFFRCGLALLLWSVAILAVVPMS